MPTYTGGDAQLYAPLTGSAAWLANFLVTLTQFGDGAVGGGQLTVANETALTLPSGTAIFWDLRIGRDVCRAHAGWDRHPSPGRPG
jgi:hypothetical protein